MKLHIFLLSFLILSCNGNEGSEGSNSIEEQSDTLSADSIFIDTLIVLEEDPNRIEIDVASLLEKGTEAFSMPLLIDSNFIDEYALQGEGEDYNLTYEEAKYLGFKSPEGDLVSAGGWRINTFIKLDSLISADAYQDYLENIDLGQARYSIAHVIGSVPINSQSNMLIWNIDYGTYEACPYGYGVYVFGTIFTNGVGTNTCLLAEDSGGGDPPSWGDSYMQSELIDSTITVFSLDRWGEYGDDGNDDIIETQERTEILGVDSYGFTVKEKGGDYNY